MLTLCNRFVLLKSPRCLLMLKSPGTAVHCCHQSTCREGSCEWLRSSGRPGSHPCWSLPAGRWPPLPRGAAPRSTLAGSPQRGGVPGRARGTPGACSTVSTSPKGYRLETSEVNKDVTVKLRLESPLPPQLWIFPWRGGGLKGRKTQLKESKHMFSCWTNAY